MKYKITVNGIVTDVFVREKELTQEEINAIVLCKQIITNGVEDMKIEAAKGDIFKTILLIDNRWFD